MLICAYPDHLHIQAQRLTSPSGMLQEFHLPCLHQLRNAPSSMKEVEGTIHCHYLGEVRIALVNMSVRSRSPHFLHISGCPFSIKHGNAIRCNANPNAAVLQDCTSFRPFAPHTTGSHPTKSKSRPTEGIPNGTATFIDSVLS